MWVSMQTGMARGTSAIGLDLATLGLLLILFQVMIGMGLKEARGESRLAARRWHFALMLGIVSIAMVHITLNSALLHILMTR